MLEILPTKHAQAKARNTSENLLNEIRQITCSLEYTGQSEYNRMDTVFMNPKNSETSDPHRLLLNLTDKTNLKRNFKRSYKNNQVSSDIE